ncbi:MAG: hypothetical protein LWX11_07210, partial [Firmicutes bacterium]|nr:hypothetical protein [Bacillota bacterium]
MNRPHLWNALESHATTGWRAPLSVALPEVPTSSRLLWCGIGGSHLPSETLVRSLGNVEAQRNWTPLASPEPMELALRPDDQAVFISKSGNTLELWTWISRLRSLPGWSKLERQPIVITQDDQNPLAKWARSEGYSILPIPV